ncbi:MAG: type II toxin-antitoxin system VapC family toxin [Desulfobacteraceae bacterium]|jgi:hypothetical protein
MMILIDSNIIIYAASGNFPALTDWLAEQEAIVSAVTMLEVLGYHKLQKEEKAELENLFSQLTVKYPTPEIFRWATLLRQERKISLGDALIAATALNEGISLATHNTSDFSWISGLSIIDPLEQRNGI